MFLKPPLKGATPAKRPFYRRPPSRTVPPVHRPTTRAAGGSGGASVPPPPPSSPRFDILLSRVRQDVIPSNKHLYNALDVALIEAQQLSKLSPDDFATNFAYLQALVPSLGDANLGRFFVAHKPRFSGLVASYTSLGRIELSRRIVELRAMLPGDGDLSLLVAWWPRILLDQFDHIGVVHAAVRRAAEARRDSHLQSSPSSSSSSSPPSSASTSTSTPASAPPKATQPSIPPDPLVLYSPFQKGQVFRLEDCSDLMDAWRAAGGVSLTEFTDKLALLLTHCPAVLTHPCLQKEPERVGRLVTSTFLLLERAASLSPSPFPSDAPVSTLFAFAERAPILLLNDNYATQLPTWVRGVESLFPPGTPVAELVLEKPGLLFLQSPDDLVAEERQLLAQDPAASFRRLQTADEATLRSMLFNFGAGESVLNGSEGWGPSAADRDRAEAFDRLFGLDRAPGQGRSLPLSALVGGSLAADSEGDGGGGGAGDAGLFGSGTGEDEDPMAGGDASCMI